VSDNYEIEPIPEFLIERFRNWRKAGFHELRQRFGQLAGEGQTPDTMIIGCCDSRVQPTDLLSAQPGELFVHRNIANLVPPYILDNRSHHGTSAAIEYAVKALKVQHIIVLGHSNCGGIRYCDHMCNGAHLEDGFLKNWMEILRPGYEKVKMIRNQEDRIRALEFIGIMTSLNNLLEYPFIKESVVSGRLSIHGLWYGISDGKLFTYSSGSRQFIQVE